MKRDAQAPLEASSHPISKDFTGPTGPNSAPACSPSWARPTSRSVEAAGRTDSIRGGIRNTFDFFPDAPFSRAVLKMRGGNKGLLVNSRDICARAYRATARFTAHNGKTHVARPKLRAQCKKRKGKRRGHKRAVR